MAGNGVETSAGALHRQGRTHFSLTIRERCREGIEIAMPCTVPGATARIDLHGGENGKPWVLPRAAETILYLKAGQDATTATVES